MKKIMFLAVMMVMSISADAISYKIARNDALFLSDKVAHELSLTKEQYEAVYDHYARDLFFFTHPRAFRHYKGDHCHEPASFYADRIAHKPATPDHHLAPPVFEPKPVVPANTNRPAGAPGRPMGMPGGMGAPRPMGGPGPR